MTLECEDGRCIGCGKEPQLCRCDIAPTPRKVSPEEMIRRFNELRPTGIESVAAELPSTTVLSTKGQVTIPERVRERWNLIEGMSFIIRFENGKVTFEPIRT